MKTAQSNDLKISAATLSLITAVYYFIQSHTDSCFQPVIVYLLVIAALLENISLFKNLDFLPMVASVCIGVAFGLMVFFALPTFSDLWNHVNFIGGNSTAYFVYLGSILAAFVLSNIPCFMKAEQPS